MRSSRFVKHHPLVRRNERERLMFMGAAGLAFSLLLLMIFVLHNRSEARSPAVQEVESSRMARPAIGTITLLAPERNVAPGTKLSAIPLREVYWPRNQVPEGAIRDRAEIASLYSKTRLPQGLPLIRANLTAQASRGSLPVRSGYRAITINVDETSGIDGFSEPGTRVDVLLTHVKDSIKKTDIIVQNARILSTNGRTEAAMAAAGVPGARNLAAAAPAARRGTVTLEVIPEDALTIQTARSMGRLGLMMRSFDDSEAPAVMSVVETDIHRGGNKELSYAPSTCTRGSVRIAGKEYSVDCSGRLMEVYDSDEP